MTQGLSLSTANSWQSIFPNQGISTRENLAQNAQICFNPKYKGDAFLMNEQNTNANPFEAGKAQVVQAAEELYAAASEKAAQCCAKAEEACRCAREKVRTLQQDGEAYVRENPLRSVAMALGAGFIVGLLLRR